MTDPKIFFQYRKGRRHGNQFSGKNGAKLPTITIFSQYESTLSADDRPVLVFQFV